MKQTHRKATEKAVALKYHKESDNAPKVIAKGSGCIANKIKQIARDNQIPLYQDDTLVELLSEVELDREIPQELYTAIAEILSWVYKVYNTVSKGKH